MADVLRIEKMIDDAPDNKKGLAMFRKADAKIVELKDKAITPAMSTITTDEHLVVLKAEIDELNAALVDI
ncbi:TPA: hypothetical protein N2817_002548 [Vibrio parahaemolyticus]|nr:hypothetical protein [Vibrio parahaemolyticus]